MSYVKVYKYKKQVSYDQGETWEDTGEYVPSGGPIGYYDTLEECMAQYRTIQSGYTCVGYDKHNQDVYEVSYDNGVTWSVVSTSAGTLIEADSPDCGYVPPTPTSPKYILTLQDSSTASAECDSTSAITSGEVSTQYSGTVVSAEIGNCVTTIDGYAFYKCYNLTSCTIPNSVTSIGNHAFESCSSLTSVTIPNSVTSINSGAFAGCSSLASCTIGSGVTSIKFSAFAVCSSLTSVTIPNSVTSIDTYAFYKCTSLTSITVEATTPPTLGSSTLDDTNNCPIYVPSGSVNTYKSASGWSDYSSRIQAIP